MKIFIEVTSDDGKLIARATAHDINGAIAELGSIERGLDKGLLGKFSTVGKLIQKQDELYRALVAISQQIISLKNKDAGELHDLAVLMSKDTKHHLWDVVQVEKIDNF